MKSAGSKPVLMAETNTLLMSSRSPQPVRLGQELRLAPGAIGEGEIACRILEKHLPAEKFLGLVNVVADLAEGFVGEGQRQEIGEVLCSMARPGEVLREKPRLIAPDQRLQPAEMGAVEGSRSADREANTVQRKRIAFADRLEIAVGRPALAHVVLGMDFEEADIGLRLDDVPVVLGLEADAAAGRYGGRAGHGGCGRARRRAPLPLRRPLDRLERARPERRFGRLAASLLDIFPGIALVVGRRGSGAGRAFAGGAIVLALEGDAVALLHFGGLGWRRGDAGDGCRHGAGKGHESYQEFADTVIPFDDRQVVRELIAIKTLKGGAA